MKVLLCISHVPDTTSKIRFANDNKEFDKTDIQYIISPFEELALTRLLDIKDAGTAMEITALTVGKAEVEPTIRKALAVGADNAIRVDADPTDAIFVAKQIADVFEKGDYDFLVTGKESIDYTGNQVGEMIAEFLGLPTVSSASHIDLSADKATITREIDGGTETIETTYPFVTSAQKGFAKEPRIPGMRGIMQARRKPLQVLPAVEQENYTTVVSHSLPEAKGACTMVSADNPAELVRLLHEEAKAI